MDFTSYNFLLAPPKSENLVHLGWRFIIHVPKRARLTKRAADLPLELHSDTTANPGRIAFGLKIFGPDSIASMQAMANAIAASIFLLVLPLVIVSRRPCRFPPRSIREPVVLPTGRRSSFRS